VLNLRLLATESQKRYHWARLCNAWLPHTSPYHSGTSQPLFVLSSVRALGTFNFGAARSLSKLLGYLFSIKNEHMRVVKYLTIGSFESLEGGRCLRLGNGEIRRQGIQPVSLRHSLALGLDDGDFILELSLRLKSTSCGDSTLGYLVSCIFMVLLNFALFVFFS